MFLAKNIFLRRKLGIPVRGRNKEANLSIGFFGLFIIIAVLLSLNGSPFGTIHLMPMITAQTVALALLAVNFLVGTTSLIGLKDSWRVGIVENQKTESQGKIP